MRTQSSSAGASFARVFACVLYLAVVLVAGTLAIVPSLTPTGPLEAQENALSAVARISPKTQTLTAAGEFSVDLLVENVPDVPLHHEDEPGGLGAFEFELSFDPSVLTFISVSVGPFLGSTGRDVVCQPPQLNGDSVRFGCVTQGTEPAPSGNGQLATVTFASSCPGGSFLTLRRVGLAEPLGKAIDVKTQGGQVECVTTPTPTETSTPTLTPTPPASSTATATASSTATPTPEETATPTATASRTPEGTTTVTSTATASSTATSTPTRTATVPSTPRTATPTATPQTPTPTTPLTPSPTATPTPTETPEVVATPRFPPSGTGFSPIPSPDSPVLRTAVLAIAAVGLALFLKSLGVAFGSPRLRPVESPAGANKPFVGRRENKTADRLPSRRLLRVTVAPLEGFLAFVDALRTLSRTPGIDRARAVHLKQREGVFEVTLDASTTAETLAQALGEAFPHHVSVRQVV